MTEAPGRPGVPSGGATAAAPLGAGHPADDPSDRGSNEQPSLGSLLSDITSDVSTLMRQEVALAKAEIADSGKKAGKGAGMLAGAGVAGHMVLVFLSVALWYGLGELFENWALSGVVVALIWAVIAAVLAVMGRKELQQVQGAPKTADSVKKIPNALKGHEEEN